MKSHYYILVAAVKYKTQVVKLSVSKFMVDHKSSRVLISILCAEHKDSKQL